MAMAAANAMGTAAKTAVAVEMATAHDGCIGGNGIGNAAVTVVMTTAVTSVVRAMVVAMAAASATAMAVTMAVATVMVMARDGCVRGNCIGNGCAK